MKRMMKREVVKPQRDDVTRVETAHARIQAGKESEGQEKEKGEDKTNEYQRFRDKHGMWSA